MVVDKFGRFCLFLDEKVHVVDTEGGQFLDGALKRHKKTAERAVGIAVG
jgi:hypothetical protein